MFKVSILNTEKILYLGLSEEVILPSEDGELTLLGFHQPILTRLKQGIIEIDRHWFFSIQDGIAHMQRGELVAIVE